jgi:cell division protein FtsL
MRIRNCEALLETQIEKTLDQARKEQLVRKKLESEYKNLSREEAKLALQLTIDAYLSSSVKQD